MKYSLKNLLIIILTLSCCFALWKAFWKGERDRAKIEQLSAITEDPIILANPNALLEVVIDGETISSPAFMPGDDKWFGGNIDRQDGPDSNWTLSYKGRYIYTVDREDVYIFFWTTKKRLPPMPRVDDEGVANAIVSIGVGGNIVASDDRWEIRVIVPEE